MTPTKQKFWVRSKYTNHIKYRALNNYEIRSPQFYANGIETYETWEDAYAANLAAREDDLRKAQKSLKSAELRLKTAKAMTAPTTPEARK